MPGENNVKPKSIIRLDSNSYLPLTCLPRSRQTSSDEDDVRLYNYTLDLQPAASDRDARDMWSGIYDADEKHLQVRICKYVDSLLEVGKALEESRTPSSGSVRSLSSMDSEISIDNDKKVLVL